MSLDVYVGSLTRYFLRDWETEAQRWVREEGLGDQLVRPPEPGPAQDAAQVQKLIDGWRDALAQELGDKLSVPLTWDERPDAPYFTRRPSWAAYGQLLVWAAYDEFPSEPPPQGPDAHWEQDPVYLRAAASSTRYAQLLRGAVWWLPVDLPWMFVADDPGGHERGMGSSVVLLRELEELNQRTFKLSGDALAEARRLGVPRAGAPPEQAARFALAVCLEMAQRSVENRLPYILDF